MVMAVQILLALEMRVLMSLCLTVPGSINRSVGLTTTVITKDGVQIDTPEQ